MPKRILARGSAGTGKSTVINKIAVDWARNVLNIMTSAQEQQVKENEKPLWNHLNSHEFLIPINLRNIEQGMTLADAIFSQMPLLEEKDVEDLCDSIKQSQNSVMFLFDGYDEYDTDLSKEITDILHNKSHLNCCVVITSRPWKANNIPNGKYVDTHIEVKGFSKANAKRYIKLYFQNTEDSSKKEQELINEIDRQNLWDLASIPIVIQLMCILRMHDKALPKSLTQLYTEIIKFMIRIHLSKDDNCDFSDDKLLADYNSVLLELGELALDGLTQFELVFGLKCTKHRLSPPAWKLGFLATTDDCCRKEQCVEFPHKSIQEFLAAYYIANDKSQKGVDILKQYCQKLSLVYDIQMVIMFLCGLNHERGNEILKMATEIAAEECIEDHQRPGPVLAGCFKPKFFPRIKSFTKFLMFCMKEYEDKSQIHVPLNDLAVLLNEETIDIVKHLFSEQENAKNIKLFCVCSDIAKDYFDDIEQNGMSSSNVQPPPNSSIHRLDPDNVKKYISVMSNSLHTLCLCFIDCSPGILELSQEISCMDKLKTLCLVEAGLEPSHICSLLDGFKFLNVQYLNLSGNVIDSAAVDIAQHLKFMDLKGIALIRAHLKNSHVKRICEALVEHCPNLEVLDLSRNQIQGSLQELVDLLVKLPKLKRLKMQDCAITTQGFLYLVEELPNFQSLTELYLSWNLCDDSISKVKQKAANFKRLEKVYMIAQNVSPRVEKEFTEAVKKLAPNTTFGLSPSLEHQRKLQKQWSYKSQSSTESLYSRSMSCSSTAALPRRESEATLSDDVFEEQQSVQRLSWRRRHVSENEVHQFQVPNLDKQVDVIEEHST